MTPTFTPTYTPTETDTLVYDFAAIACLAQWTSGAGQLPCPGVDGSSEGFVLSVDSPTLEDGTLSRTAGLLTSPQFVDGGYIRGFYPAIPVQSGYHFKATIGCENGATNCLVLFKLEYRIDSGPALVYWAYGEQSDGKNKQVDLDLNLLTGENVSFGITVFSVGSPAVENRALWIAPRIVQTRASQ